MKKWYHVINAKGAQRATILIYDIIGGGFFTDGTTAKEFTNTLFPAAYNHQTNTFKESRGFKRVIELFDGAGMGSNNQGVYGTKWGLLNAVTQYVDHERGHNVDSRMNNAWFGNGNRMKTQAEELLLA